MIVGIDDGSAHVGLAIVQKCPTKNKVVFKGTIEQRQDVKHLMDIDVITVTTKGTDRRGLITVILPKEVAGLLQALKRRKMQF